MVFIFNVRYIYMLYVHYMQMDPYKRNLSNFFEFLIFEINYIVLIADEEKSIRFLLNSRSVVIHHLWMNGV